MKNVKLNSKLSSGALSLTRSRSQKQTERSFLADQARDAKTAMNQSLQDMKGTLKTMLDVRLWAKQHPWVVTGSAVAVGFVVGDALAPSPRKDAKKASRQTEARLQASCRGLVTPEPKNSFLFSTSGTILASILRTVVQGLLAAAFVTKNRVETSTPDDSTGVVAPKNAD